MIKGDKKAGLIIWTKKIPKRGTISDPPMLWALFTVFARELIITFIWMNKKEMRGDMRKPIKIFPKSMKIKILPSKYGKNMRLVINPNPKKQVIVINKEGMKEVIIFPIKVQYLLRSWLNTKGYMEQSRFFHNCKQFSINTINPCMTAPSYLDIILL